MGVPTQISALLRLHKRMAVIVLAFGLAASLGAAPGPLVAEALAAEARLDSARALELFLAADAAQPDDPFILQNIAQQYSDLVLDQPTRDGKRRYAELALSYAERAVARQPDEAVNVLSVAICHGKLATLADTREKVARSRLVKEFAERALRLDPDYAWAHHVLGRWHREVALLTGTQRFFVGLLYGGLPKASHAEAVQHLARAVELEPEDCAHHLELGFAYGAQGRVDDARQAWQRGLALPSRNRHDEPAKARARAALESLALP